MISLGEKCFTPPLRAKLFTNLTISCSTIRTTIMPGTLSKGKLWQRERIFSLRNLTLRSISPQCCKAAAQSSLGDVGRPTTTSLMEANSWSPFITTIWKPQRKFIMYVAFKATQITSLFLLVRWVIVVKHILVLKVVKNTCLLTKKQSIASSTSYWSLMSSLGTLTIICVTRLTFHRTVFPFILRTDRPQITSAALTLSIVTTDPGTPPVLTIALKLEVKGKIIFSYRLVWAKKVSLAAICLDISSASFGIRIN